METKVHNITKQLDDSYYQKKIWGHNGGNLNS